MTSLILRTSARLMFPLLLLFSIFLMLRGHNAPGGGFAGGLFAAAAFAMQAIAESPAAAKRALRVDPHLLIGIGLLLALASGVWSLAYERPFLTGLWFDLHWVGEGGITLGSPLLFDLGVYLAVVGVTTMVILALAEQDELQVPSQSTHAADADPVAPPPGDHDSPPEERALP